MKKETKKKFENLAKDFELETGEEIEFTKIKEIK